MESDYRYLNFFGSLFGRAACWSGQGPVKPPPLCLQVRVLPRPSG